MDEHAPATSKLDQIRTILFGGRVEVLERRIEILATNLGKEIEAARTEILRRLEPFEERLTSIEEARDAEREEFADLLRRELETLRAEGEARFGALRERMGDELAALRGEKADRAEVALAKERSEQSRRAEAAALAEHFAALARILNDRASAPDGRSEEGRG